MMIIGVDPHKSTHTATAVDPQTNRTVASVRIQASLADYRRLLRWAGQFDRRRWAIENAEGLGRHLSSWLLARGEDVVDVRSTATAGGAPTDLSATTAAALLRQVRPSGDAERVRKQIATSLVGSANSSQLRGAPRPAPSASARSPQVV